MINIKNSLFPPGSSFLHRSHKPLMIGVALLILASAPGARCLLNWLKANLGIGGLKLLVAVIFLVAAAALVILTRPWTMPRANIILLGILLLAGLVYSFFLSIPEERIHLVEYGLLGLLACPSLKDRSMGSWKRLSAPVLFVFFVGGLDELFQWILPNRVGDLRDIFFNALGGIWGIGLYLAATASRKQAGPSMKQINRQGGRQ
jgi:hypothetical protein